jgi:hypothetical protein
MKKIVSILVLLVLSLSSVPSTPSFSQSKATESRLTFGYACTSDVQEGSKFAYKVHIYLNEPTPPFGPNGYVKFFEYYGLPLKSKSETIGALRYQQIQPTPKNETDAPLPLLAFDIYPTPKNRLGLTFNLLVPLIKTEDGSAKELPAKGRLRLGAKEFLAECRSLRDV